MLIIFYLCVIESMIVMIMIIMIIMMMMIIIVVVIICSEMAKSLNECVKNFTDSGQKGNGLWWRTLEI